MAHDDSTCPYKERLEAQVKELELSYQEMNKQYWNSESKFAKQRKELQKYKQFVESVKELFEISIDNLPLHFRSELKQLIEGLK